MNQDQVMSIGRWVLTLAGGALVSRGLATDGQVQTVIGGVLPLISLGLSMLVHK